MAETLNLEGDHLMFMMVHINELHYSYLYAHEGLRKLEEKNRLEGHIRDYLMVAPHDKKFCYHETTMILNKSAAFKENFSGYRASASWTAIAAYAHNLLAQSWRKEFREIKTYSGFYKHNVESGLSGSELMLTLMGYRQTGDGTYTLEGPVDPDRVANVSRDSLIALVECQIVCSLYADLIKSGCNYTWLDIIEYRQAHPCSIEQALHGLIYQYNQRYISSCRPDCYSQCHSIIDRSTYNQSHYRIPNNLQLPYYADNPDGMIVAPSCHIPNQMNKCTTCCKDVSANVSARPSNSCSVPTGQLIELDVSYVGKEDYVYNPDNPQRIFPDRIDTRNYNTSPHSNDTISNISKQKHKDSSWDNWEPSFQPIENKKNHKYDLVTDKRHFQYDELEDALNAFHLDESQPSCSTTDIKKTEKTTVDKNLKKSKHEFSNTFQSSVQTLGRDVPKKTDANYMSLKVKLNEKWECSACTFHNSNDKDVCEICSKSKTMGNELQPLVSGGRQCPQCTLVNEKGVTLCDACGTNLKDSPTYI